MYLLCFVRDRYQRLNDNLLGAFCSLVRRYVEQVTVATKEAIYRSKLQTGEDVEQGAKVMALLLDPSIDGHTPFARMRDQATTSRHVTARSATGLRPLFVGFATQRTTTRTGGLSQNAASERG